MPTLKQAVRQSRAPAHRKADFASVIASIAAAETKGAALHAEWKRLNDIGSALMQRWYDAATEEDMRSVAGEMQQIVDAIDRLVEQAQQAEGEAAVLGEQLQAAWEAEDNRITTLTDLLTDVSSYGDENELQTEIDSLDGLIADLGSDGE